jgi:hypothetical protein
MADVLRRHKRNGEESPPHSSRGRLYSQEMKKRIDKSLEEIEKRTDTPASREVRKKIATAISLGIPVARITNLGIKMVSGTPAAMASARATLKAAIGKAKKLPSGSKVVTYKAPVGGKKASTFLSKAEQEAASGIRKSVAGGAGLAAIASTVGDKDKKKSVKASAPVPKQKPTPPSKTKIPAAVKPLIKSKDDGKKVIEVSKDKEPSKTLQKQYGEWSEKNPETFWNRLGKFLDVSVEYDYPGEQDNYKKGGKIAKRKMDGKVAKRKMDGKVAKRKMDGKVSKPRGCGAALRGYGKAMKKGK